MSAEEAAIRSLIQSYKDLTGSESEMTTPSSWVLIGPKNEIDGHYAEVCHAGIKYSGPTKWESMLLPVRGDYAISYITALLEGPFRKFSEWVSLEEYEDIPYMQVIGLSEFPANALMNFIMASRAPIEFQANVHCWHQLTELGMSSDLALIICGIIDATEPPKSLDQKVKLAGVSNTNHWWMGLPSNWDNILAGEPIKLAVPYNQDKKACTPVTVIWGEGWQNKTYELFEKSTLQQIMDKFKQ